jgi:hypothetical protein
MKGESLSGDWWPVTGLGESLTANSESLVANGESMAGMQWLATAIGESVVMA